MMDVAVLFSGGKDSTYAVFEALEQGHRVRCLLVMESENPDSYMFHRPNIELTGLQAESMGIKIVFGKTKGEKEKELGDLEGLINRVKGEVNYIGAGALASQYQYERVGNICRKLGLKVFAPAWKANPKEYWKHLLELGFRIIITKVSCEGLGKEWLGKEIDKNSLESLVKLSEKYRFHLGFEGGEAETFVLDCPVFKKRIEIISGRNEWYGDSGIYLIEKAKMVDK
jgi:ABC transporter with metal-binding/Fe-S-binding domain ATP-binding protein